jgi:hypothetical protein
MLAMVTTHSAERSSTSRIALRHGIALDQVAAIARRRASKINTGVSTDVLVQQTLRRYDQTFGSTSRPVDLDGWVRRTLREIGRIAERDQRRANAGQGDHTALMSMLEGLTAPVRSPALAKQRKLLLRRISELVPGPEGRTVLAMTSEPSLDRVADKLSMTPIDVAQLQRRGLEQLGDRLQRDPELAEQLRAACRQPKRARTSH